MVISQLRNFQFATSGVQLLLFVLAAQLESRLAWLICLPLMALLSLAAWLAALKKYRTIEDTPTSKIASAAQGYVELIGKAACFIEKQPITSPLGHTPCLWYRYSIERKDHDGDWNTVESGDSSMSFLLRDDSGQCSIDPDGAEILSQHKKIWTSGRYRYHEWLLLEHDSLYVLGDFQTLSGVLSVLDRRVETGALLAKWKEDMPALQARFDLNQDGMLDEQEWMLARRAARREVGNIVAEVQTRGDVNVVQKPVDGRMFVISNLMPEQLKWHYLRWVWGNFILFFLGVGGFAFVLQRPDL